MPNEHSKEVAASSIEEFRFALKLERSIQSLRQSIEALKLPRSDTFLGRSTYEPFPLEEDAP
jgi:hypothetical protein